MDPRLADRRKEVAEDRARRNIRRLLRLILFFAAAGALVWLFLSPTLSVDHLEIHGVSSSRATEILEDERVGPGRPLILIRTGSVEQRLLADPWIKTADVDLDWPNGVIVNVEERAPVAWVRSAGGWARRAVDGVALPGSDTPDDTMGHVILPEVADEGIYESFEVTGALEFLDNLPVTLSSDATVEQRGSELWAIVAGFEVRLGRPAEMKAKALTLATLLEQGLPAGSQINLIAPTNPAVSPGVIVPPDDDGNPDDDGGGSGTGSGDN